MDAAVEGLVDYREARILDPRWWQRCRVLYRALNRRKRARATDIAYRLTLAQVANSGLSESSFKNVQDRAIEMQYDLIGAEMPWEGASYRDRKRSEFTSARQQFIQAFGQDPSDPVYKAYVDDVVRRTMAGEFDTPPEKTSAQVVIERMQARTEAQQRHGGRKQ